MAIVGKNFSWDFEVFFLGGSCLQAPQTLASAGRFRSLIHSESHSSRLRQAAAYYDFPCKTRLSLLLCPERKQDDER